MTHKQSWADLKASLHEYAIYLREHGDPKRPAAAFGKRYARRQPHVTQVASFGTLLGWRATDKWERKKLVEWWQAGRMTSDCTLRTSSAPLPPYTMQTVKRAFPWLKTWDALALLVDLDGVVEEDFMDAHRNIRAAIDEMIDLALERKLPEKLGMIFGRVAEQVKEDRGVAPEDLSTQSIGGRKLKCSKCRQPGHRAPTCQGTPSDPGKEQVAEGVADA